MDELERYRNSAERRKRDRRRSRVPRSKAKPVDWAMALMMLFLALLSYVTVAE